MPSASALLPLRRLTTASALPRAIPCRRCSCCCCGGFSCCCCCCCCWLVCKCACCSPPCLCRLRSHSAHIAACCLRSLLSTANDSPTGHATMARPSSTCCGSGRHDSSAECSGRSPPPHCSGTGPRSASSSPGGTQRCCSCSCRVIMVGAAVYANTKTATVCASVTAAAAGRGTCVRQEAYVRV